MLLTKEEATKLHKKLENRFKKSGNPLVEKLADVDSVELSDDEVKVLRSKVEYTFSKKTDDELLNKLRSVK